MSVDLANTRWIDDGVCVDWLDDQRAVEAFAATHGHEVDVAELVRASRELADVRSLIDDLFVASVESGDLGVAPELLDRIDNVLDRARLRVERSAGHPAVVTTAADPVDALVVEAVVDALDILATRAARLRRCAHEACILWFVDTSKSGRRRWCSMDTCGNRAKAKRHYDRTIRAARD